jgi:hypothetical protein
MIIYTEEICIYAQKVVYEKIFFILASGTNKSKV